VTPSPTPSVHGFDAIAEEYDGLFTYSSIGKAQRASVWEEMDRAFSAGQRIVEINCGTGVDAVHLAERGIQVVACDASARMIDVARRRLYASPLRRHIDFRVLATEDIHQLESARLFDGVLSNFAGLNCLSDLSSVARDLARLVRPGGKVVLCLFGRYCLWEFVWYALQGKFKKAMRRLGKQKISASLAPGNRVWIHYPSLGSLHVAFAPHFRLMRWKGVGIFVPPSYLEPWAARLAGLLRLAAKFDALIARWPGFRSLADHVVLTLERVEG
jgi:ubiquinone/menaquinone biosynthesis C-methylase UbiE